MCILRENAVKTPKFFENVGYVYQCDVYDGRKKAREGGTEPCSYALGTGRNRLIVQNFHCESGRIHGIVNRFEGGCTTKAGDLPKLPVIG